MLATLLSVGWTKEAESVVNKTQHGYQFGTKHTILYRNTNPISINPGDSISDRTNAQLALEKAQRETIARDKIRSYEKVERQQGSGNGYAYGWCTYFVKQEKPEIPNNWGNAINWPTNTDTPRVGSVVKTRESRLGHVAIVIEVKSSSIVIKEMNGTAGWNRVNTREILINYPLIVGYYN